MSGLETAIRNALDKADRSNPEIRARIYQSARQALETGLRKQDVSDPAVVAHQRHRLETTIRTIETEERQKLGIAVADPVADIQYGDFEADMANLDDARAGDEDPDTGNASFGGLRAERLSDGGPVGRGQPMPNEPTLSGAPSGRPAGRPTGRPSGGARPRKRRGFFARLFIWVMLLAFLAAGAWWALTSGLLMSAAERDTSVANPPAAVSEEDLPDPADGDVAPAQNQSSTFSKDWIEVFKPGEIKRIAAGSLAEAKLTSTGDGPVIRITSRSGEAEGAVRVLLPAEIMRKAQGQEATLAITMRSANDKPVQVTVDCELGGIGSCERHRFTVMGQRLDALLQLAPAEGDVDQPALVLNADATGEGGGVDLVAVRLLPNP